MSSLTREQTRRGRQQEGSADEESVTCEEAQKRRTNTNNRSDAEISRQIPAESDSHTLRPPCTRLWGWAEAYTNHDIYFHARARAQSLKGAYGCHLPARDQINTVLFEGSSFLTVPAFLCFFNLLHIPMTQTHTCAHISAQRWK